MGRIDQDGEMESKIVPPSLWFNFVGKVLIISPGGAEIKVVDQQPVKLPISYSNHRSFFFFSESFE